MISFKKHPLGTGFEFLATSRICGRVAGRACEIDVSATRNGTGTCVCRACMQDAKFFILLGG